MKIIHITVTIALSTITPSQSFAPSIHKNCHDFKQQRTLTSSVFYATASDSNDASNAGSSLERRTCISNFLTQRSLQSFMFLLNEMKDPHTNLWLGDFLGTSHKTLLSFHGSGALDLERFYEWDNVFNELMVKPLDAVIVEVKPRGEGRGLSKNNPYRMLEHSEPIEVEIDIDPPSLANRILSVRDKMSKEWAADLDLLIASNQQILSSYAAKRKEARETEEANEGDYERGSSEPIQPGLSGGFNFGQRSVQSFYRASVYYITNHPNFNAMDATPLRASSFDLLFLLSMQEAIHRVLKSYQKAGEEKEVSFAWLNTLYNESLEKYFDGNQSFGRSDDFLDDLLSKPPALKIIGGKIGFIDPLAIAEDIISVREEVALEWKDTMLKVELDHADIRTEIFRCQMVKWDQTVEHKKNVEEKEQIAQPTPRNHVIIETGDFE